MDIKVMFEEERQKLKKLMKEWMNVCRKNWYNNVLKKPKENRYLGWLGQYESLVCWKFLELDNSIVDKL